MRQRLHVPSWSGRSIDCRRFRLTSFRGVVVGSGDEVYALTPFDRDGVAAEYAVVPADVLALPLRLSHVEAAALPMGGLTAWQALFVHGRLARGERCSRAPRAGVGHIAVQLARHAGAAVVESGPVDLVFDTRGGEVSLASAWSRSQRRCRARPTSSSNPTTSNCWS